MPGTTRLLEVDPDLGQDLTPEQFAVARRELVVEELRVPSGRWDSEKAYQATGADFGLLLVEGVLMRDLEVGSKSSLEVLGAGDLLRRWPRDRHPPEVEVTRRFTAVDPLRFAVLDARFVSLAARWPSVLGELADRAMGRASSASLRLIVHQYVRVEDRILLSLWGLAERFGRVTPEGVLVPLPLNNTMMARLVGAQRPSVSTAVGQLERRGLISRPPQGWLLHGEFPIHLVRDRDGHDDAHAAPSTPSTPSAGVAGRSVGAPAA
jgi:hypothetical protein